MINNRQQSATRTDDLLASGADSKDGAQGYSHEAPPESLKTGMEGITKKTTSQGNKQIASQRWQAR